MDLKELEVLGASIDTHWYYRSKLEFVRSLLDRASYTSVIDVGAGSGFFSTNLLRAGFCTSAVCVDSSYEADREESVNGSRVQFVTQNRSTGHDLALFMDVIEHVDDDVDLLRQYLGALVDGATVVITVPAFQLLWSGHDEFLEHRRRYTLRQLEQVTRAAGLEVMRGRYLFGFLFPVAAAQRIVGRLASSLSKSEPRSALKDAPGWMSTILTNVHRVERATLLPFNRLAGLTAICIARKPH